MTSRLGIAAWGVVLPFAITFACSKSNTGGSGGPARGTTACQGWQSAICAWGARCASVEADKCQAQVSTFACVSDARAQSCTTSFNAAPCDNPPSGCSIVDVVDPVPARAACNQLIDEFCASLGRCSPSPGTVEACHQSSATALSCASALGVTAAFEQCIADIKGAMCPVTALPTNCGGTIILGN